ncbi:MAG: transporter substrate-binding domain-containing protein [Pseudodesulfovibrio sp.]
MKAHLTLLIFTILFCATPAHAQEEVLFVGGAPLDTYQPRIIVPLLEEAFKRNGIEFKAEHYPSPRALLMSNTGIADGELHRIYDFHTASKGKYPNLIRIESHLMSVHVAVFSNVYGTAITKWEDLKECDVGYLRGRQNVKTALEALSEETKTFPQSSELGLFRMLEAGRINYVVSESFEGQRILAAHPEFKAVREVAKLEETKIYAYMNKKHATLAKKIGETLEEMKRDRTFQRIKDHVRTELLAEGQRTSSGFTLPSAE